MKKRVVILLISLYTCFTFSQEKLIDINLKIDKRADFFEIVDSKSKELLLYYRDSDISKVIRTNEKFEIIDSLFLEKPNKIFKNYLGEYKKDGIYSMYWANDKKDSVFYQNIDFHSRIRKSKNICINLNKEKVVKTIAVGNKYFIISIPRKGNILTFHQFTEDKYEIKKIDFSGQIFYFSGNKETNFLWEVFNEGSMDFLNIQTISDAIPTSLPLTKNKRKVYMKDEKELIFTFDNSFFVTQILKINLENFSFTLENCRKTILKPENVQSEYATLSNTNSFLCNDKIFQIISNSETIIIDVKNSKFENIKSFKIEKDKEIEFANSDILKENMSISNTRVLDKSSQFIRKLNNLHLGLTCYFKDDKYYLTIGGFTDVENNNAMYASMFGITGALLTAALTPSYSIQNVNSYANRQVVYINSVLDENLNHVAGKFNRLTFDNLRLYIEQNKDLRNLMVFKFDETIYFGGYNKKENKISFFKFN